MLSKRGLLVRCSHCRIGARIWVVRSFLLKRTQIIERLLEERSFTFFATLSKRRLKRGVFRSIVELQAAIKRFLAETNADPRPFRWTKDPDKSSLPSEEGTKC